MIWSTSIALNNQRATYSSSKKISISALIAHHFKKTLTMILFAFGCYFISDSLLIHTKAVLAQYLIANAWQQTIDTGDIVKPWPWADTWPVNRLQVEDYNIDLYVLEGLQGSALAFGPGRLTTANNSAIIAGHRDTHFSFVEQLIIDDTLKVTNSAGVVQQYRVTDLSIEDSSLQQLSIDDGSEQLILITCYPFNAISAGGSLRYVVKADVINTNSTYK